MGRGPRIDRLDFGGDPDHDLYYCGSCTQPRIKRENCWRRFELSECFLVILLWKMLMQSMLNVKNNLCQS